MRNRGDKNRRLRGRILQLLMNLGDAVATRQFLDQTFERAGDVYALESLDRNVDYLIDRGYVEEHEVRDDGCGVKRDILRLTADGIDLIEGTRDPDPGVLIVE